MKVVPLCEKDEKLVIGIMSGTSCDGVDAALVKIKGFGEKSKVDELGFITIPYPAKVKERLLKLIQGKEGGSYELTMMSFLLGRLFKEAAIKLCDKYNISYSDIDLIASHGHTFYHQPSSVDYLGYDIRGTMQLGDISELAEFFSCPVVSDFRTRDFAAGGMGAPLVPYTEYLLFTSDEYDSAYQNIGGIGNITFLKRGASESDVFAFDTGPGNALIDLLIKHYTSGEKEYDEAGLFASKGEINQELKEFFLSDEYYLLPPPKSTGREYYNQEYVDRILKIANERSISSEDVVYTATWFTCECIRKSIKESKLDIKLLIVSGGGSHNRTIMKILREMLDGCTVITGSEYGINSDSKEAVAFAILANEAVCGHVNVLVGATGAKRASILGKIQL